MDLSPRLRAVCDLDVAVMRENSGRHEYDGKPQDLSPEGVRAGLARLAAARLAAARDDGERLADPHDEAQLAAAEDLRQVTFGELELHRRNPILHLVEMELTTYELDYAPAAERAAAWAEHLATWPRLVDAAIESLDQVSAPSAQALLGAARGLAAGISEEPGASAGGSGVEGAAGSRVEGDAGNGAGGAEGSVGGSGAGFGAGVDEGVRKAALAAHARLIDYLERCAAEGDPDPALGGAALSALMSSAEALPVDLGRLAEQADAERDRLLALLAEGCAQVAPGRPALEVARELVRVHPDAQGVVDAGRIWAQRSIDFTRERDLVPYHDGICLVGVAPESRRWAMAMMTAAAPGEPDHPSWFHITPPEESWPDDQKEEWLEVFSDTTLPGIALHEVAPGHFSHSRALRRLTSDVRRIVLSTAFIEGWAHYAEELSVEEGFGADDPRIAIGVWLEALVRVTRLACAIGVHTAGMTVEQAADRFEADTHLSGPAALSEAQRATFDPTYGRYTWGKLEILKLRERARKEWGTAFTLQRFHKALLDLGSPPLGLLGTAVERG